MPPRTAATANSKKHQHNSRHENGLVGPGKRVAKQKSNGHLNGSPIVGSHPVEPPFPSPIVDDQLMTHSEDNHSNGSLVEPKLELDGSTHTGGLRTRNSESSYENSEVYENGTAVQTGPDEHVCRRADTSASRKQPSHEINALQLASTILKSCPVYDTLAILIFLLQLPPIVLTLVQVLFASLTFMPPSGVSTSPLSSAFDLFHGPAGTPTLPTMLAVDAFCLLIWFCLYWPWAQNFALDLAQVQVAITLGGGIQGKNGGINVLCVFIVLCMHLARSQNIRRFVFDYILSSKFIPNEWLTRYAYFLPTGPGIAMSQFSPNWMRTMLAIHILAQAVTAIVRRAVPSNQSKPQARPGKRTDTEASAGTQPVPDSSAFESAASVSSAAGVEGQSVASPGLKDGKERNASAKKRRRQANQVRSRQPFWAALASTKVTVMREYEHQQAANKGAGRKATNNDNSQHSFLEERLVWITHIGPSSIQFEASDIFPADDTADDDESAYSNVNFKPFYVRINGADWASTTICNLSESTGGRLNREGDGERWAGEISGLAPNFTYTCTFIRSDNHEEICVITAKTPALPDTEQTSSTTSPPPRQSLRPSSPTTTIKNSIANAEAKLNEVRNRQKRVRRDHRAQLDRIKKDVDNYNSRLKGGVDDNRQRQKLLQAERNIRQTEEATSSIISQLEDLEEIPEVELDEWNAKKCAYNDEKGRLNAAKEELATARSAASRELTTIRTELASTIGRRDRLLARQKGLQEKHDRITLANTQGLNEKERKAAEHVAKEKEQAQIEQNFNEQFHAMTRQIQELQARTHQAWQQAHAIEKTHQQQLLMNAGTLTPEGNLPGTNGPLSQTQNQPAPASATRSFFPPFGPINAPTSTEHAQHNPSSPFLPHTKLTTNILDNTFTHRQRSSSNRSGRSSTFTADFSDADPIPPMPSEAEILGQQERKGSGGSGGGGSAKGVSPVSRGKGSPALGFWG